MKKDKCPICGEVLLVTLVEELTDNFNPGKFVQKISSRCDVPYTIPCSKGIMVQYHYSNAVIDDKEPYFEKFVIYPYIIHISRYTNNYNLNQDTMDIHKFDNQYLLHYVMEMPILDLPWNDLDKVRNKLNTFVVFS